MATGSTHIGAVKTVGIVSLSSGTLGEAYARHELELGLSRLRAWGLKVKLLPNALRGVAALRAHPEWRAADLIQAFADPEIDLILCAIGGEEGFRLLPHLFAGDALKKALRDKLFLGFSDTSTHHLVLHKLGLPTYYGQSFLADVCELGPDMLPYSKQCFLNLVRSGQVRELRPSPLWYEAREDFGPEQLGTETAAHENAGFILLQGAPRFRGKLLGGCVDTLFDYFDGTRFPEAPAIAARYGLFPRAEDWRGRILFLETSENKMPPERYRAALRAFKAAGVFDGLSGVLCGKAMDECYEEDYRRILLEEIGHPALPVVCNLSVGHALPRAILPFGVEAEVDAAAQRIRFAARPAWRGGGGGD